MRGNSSSSRLAFAALFLAVLAAMTGGAVAALHWGVLFPDSPLAWARWRGVDGSSQLTMLAQGLQRWGEHVTWISTVLAGSLLVIAAVTRRQISRLLAGATLFLIAVALVFSVVPSVAQRRWVNQQVSTAREEALTDPRDAHAWLNYSRWLAREGELNRALGAAHRARAVAIERVYECDLMVGLLELALEHHAAALPSLRSAYLARGQIREEWASRAAERRQAVPEWAAPEEAEALSSIPGKEAIAVVRAYAAGLILAGRWEEAQGVLADLASEPEAQASDWLMLLLAQRAGVESVPEPVIPASDKRLSPEQRAWLSDQSARVTGPEDARRRMQQWARSYVAAATSGD